MFEYIASFDPAAATALTQKKAWEVGYKAAYDKAQEKPTYESDYKITAHSEYFALMDIRPAAITTKLRQRQADAYDFAAHANPSTTHKHYDRRLEKRASATE